MMAEDRRRILLVEPPFHRLFKPTYSLDRYPLALGYLAGTIRKDTTWGVRAFNADFTPDGEAMKVRYQTGEGFRNYLRQLKDPSGEVWREVRSAIAEYSPGIVGISAKTQNFASARIVARLAKEADPRTIVVVGGPHPSMVGAEVLKHPEIDVGVRGEGERTIVELLTAVEKGAGFDHIAGLAFRKDGQAVETPPRELISDLDSLCFPHESAAEALKDYGRYPPAAFQYVFATRGCPYRCFFCGSHKVWGRKVRFRSSENVAREISALREKGLRCVHFDDDTFGLTPRHIRDLCSVLAERCAGLRWSCEMHVKLIDDATLSVMKSAGCYSVQVGIESGNNGILEAIRKDITIEEALAACERVRKHGIELRAFFIVGFPQETESTLADTAEAMKKVRCDALIYSIFTPYPGTEAFDLCKKKGLIGDDYDVALYNHQSPANYFCPDIAPDRFRELLSGIERMVDGKNWQNRVKRIFSLRALWRIQDLGLRNSLRKGVRLLLGK